MKLSLKEVFIQSQTGMQCHPKLLKAIQSIYNATEFEAFWAEFVHYLKYPMIVFKREPAVERTLDFVAKFITSVGTTPETAEEDESTDDVEGNRLLQEMFNFLLQSHSAADRSVRFRCCQMINKLLSNLRENAQIDDELYDKIYDCMLERLRDKVPVVRYHAVLALARLQDPTDENCPVIKSYLFLLSCDPNPEVRLAVLRSIAPSTKTLRAMLERTRDVKDTVRKEAYLILAEKVHIKAMSIAFRVQLLHDGLSDRSEIVRNACTSKLLQTWLRTFSGNVLELLKCLDVENATETCEKTLQQLFEASTVEQLVENFDLLDEIQLVPVEKLTCESSMYWQQVCKFIHGKGTDYEVHLEKVLPNCMQYAQYVQSYVDGMKGCEDLDQRLEKEFIIQQLLLITSYMDLADQASRKALESLFHDMLLADHVPHSLMKYVVPRLCDTRNNNDSMVQYIAETVSDIRQPITVIEKGPSQEEKRQMDLKIASIRVKLNQIKEELEECVRNQEFARAAELKATVAELDAERSQILESGEPEVEEIRTEKDDPLTVLKCLTIIAQMIEALPLKSINSTLQMILESQIVPGVSSAEPDVRNVAIHALGLCCYLSRDLVLQYLPLFMQVSQVDTEGVRITALQVTFDLIHIYGLEVIREEETQEKMNSEENSPGETSEMSAISEKLDTDSNLDTAPEAETKTSLDKQSATAAKLIAILSSFLDNESPELRTVASEGLAKLLLSCRVVSSKILSHLLLLWYNPLTEDDSHLRHCLGTFFPIYALANRTNQEVIEEAFMPTLKTLMDAPSSSPLADVNIGNVAEMLVQLTNSRLLMENQKNDCTIAENPGHDNIAANVCNEILSCPDSFNLKLWVKILNQLQPSQDNTTSLKNLTALCDSMLQVVKEKPCLKSLEKFQSNLKKMYQDVMGHAMKNEEPESTQENIDQEKSEDAVPDSHTITLMPGPEADLTALDVSQHLMGDDEEESVPEPLTLSKAVRTKSIALTPTGRKPRSKYTISSDRKTRTLDLAEDSELDNSVFTSPTPLRSSMVESAPSALETTRRNLEEMMLEDEKLKGKGQVKGKGTPKSKGKKDGEDKVKGKKKLDSKENNLETNEETTVELEKGEIASPRPLRSNTAEPVLTALEATRQEIEDEKPKGKGKGQNKEKDKKDSKNGDEVKERIKGKKKSEGKENDLETSTNGKTRASRRLQAAKEAK